MAAAQVSPLPIEHADREDRRRMVDSALGTTLAEGVSPSPEVLALFDAYTNGEISLDEILPAIRSLDAR
ncbi:MAG: antitoxin VbhA family protein [Acidobacteriota bacterium]